MLKMTRRVIIVVNTRVTGEFVRAGEALFARGISAYKGFFSSVGSNVSGLKDDKKGERVRGKKRNLMF